MTTLGLEPPTWLLTLPLSQGRPYVAALLAKSTRPGRPHRLGGRAGPPPRRTDKPLGVERLERAMITEALREHGGNISQAARRLGLHRQSL